MIVIYEPDYAIDAPAREGVIPRGEITNLMGDVNKCHTVLKILREARQPLSTAECAVRFAGEFGLADGDARVTHIANRLPAVLD